MLLFIHIRKPAGQTFKQILSREYPGGVIRVDLQSEADSRSPAPTKLRNAEQAGKQVIAGHFPFGVHRWLEGPCRYVTFLRDPVDRVISRYYYLIDRPGTPHYAILREKAESLEDALDLQPRFPNWQTRVMAGTDPDGRYRPKDPCPEETLARAKANLERCDAIGLTERFDESLVLMKLALGWGTPAYVRQNTTKSRPHPGGLPPAHPGADRGAEPARPVALRVRGRPLRERAREGPRARGAGAAPPRPDKHRLSARPCDATADPARPARGPTRAATAAAAALDGRMSSRAT